MGENVSDVSNTHSRPTTCGPVGMILFTIYAWISLAAKNFLWMSYGGVPPPGGRVSSTPVIASLSLEIESTILLFLKSVKHSSIFFQNPKDSKSALIFHQPTWLSSYHQCCNYSLNEICKTYLGTVLPPSSRNWQLIYLCSVCSKH